MKEGFPEKVAKKLATLMGKMYKELVNTVTKEEFKELKKVVEELAEAQRRTEEELRELIQEHRETRKQLGGLTTTWATALRTRHTGHCLSY